jgi:hypothetical protein
VKRLLVIALLFTACRTARPVGEHALEPVTSSKELAQRRETFAGQRSIVRVRITNGTQTQSVRGQLQVARNSDMLITLFAPIINTTAVRLYASNGRIVFLNDIDRTAWQGSASDFTGSLGFIGSNPSALAFLILGLPANDATVEYGQAGLQSARLRDMVIAYDPAVYPPKKVVIVRGTQRVEIDHLEDYVSAAPIPPLTVPSDYRCCVLPQF